MNEVQVLEGALKTFREEGFQAGTYFPDPDGSYTGYCAIGGLIRAAGGVEANCEVYREGSPFNVAAENRSRAAFMAANPSVVRAHARLEANLGMTLEDLAAADKRPMVSAKRDLKYYGGSLLEYWVEEVNQDPTAVIALFERALAEARSDEAAAFPSEQLLEVV